MALTQTKIGSNTFCGDIARWGADQDEADHNGVVVEEVPASERDNYKHLSLPTYTKYNQDQTAGKECLKTGFVNIESLYGTLSHSHLLIVLLCWKTRAHWDWKDKDDTTRFCDSEGNLDLSAVADKVLEKLVAEGLLVEVLGWELNVEEPMGASLISQALNKGQEAALKTSELTALSVLKG